MTGLDRLGEACHQCGQGSAAPERCRSVSRVPHWSETSIESVCFTRNTGETQGRSDIIILLELRLLRCEIDGGRRLLEPTQRQRVGLADCR